jgi:recombination DNA repair RAD52 pathway protein
MSEENKSLIKAKKSGDMVAIVNTLFATKTPKQFIKNRPGPGGRSLSYVEVGYVVSVLNNAFGPFWEWRITDKHIGEKQIWVQGELTVKDQNGFSITKAGFGGALVKLSTATREPISIANDLKAASSDALKKAASLFGIASDLFYREMDLLEESPEEIDEVSDGYSFVRDQVTKKFFATAAAKGFTAVEAKEVIKKKYKVAHMEELTVAQLEETIANLEAIVEKVQTNVQVVEVEKFDQCRQCEKVFDPFAKSDTDSAYFCSKKCQDLYYPLSKEKPTWSTK